MACSKHGLVSRLDYLRNTVSTGISSSDHVLASPAMLFGLTPVGDIQLTVFH
jgi:hypothetical protein